jgi:hypothetical protein
MELFAKTLVVVISVFAVAASFLVAHFYIRAQRSAAKQWIDLWSTFFGAASFVTAAFGVSSLLRLHEGVWLLDYPIIGKPSLFTFLLPLLLAVALGFSLAKRWSDLMQARNN